MSYSEPLSNQLRVLFLSVGVGVLLCVIYVVLQGLLRALGEGRLSYYLADGLFCVAFALVSFFFMVIYAGGRVRLHLILGEGTGFLLFYFSAGKYLYRILQSSAVFLRRLLIAFFKPYAFIFSSFAGGIKSLGKKIAAIFTKKRNFTKKEEKN